MRAVIHKERGETPLAALERFKAAHSMSADTPACYAGRLDPMAEGKLLLLFGEACKDRERYQGLDKEYVIQVLVDVGSDTGDILGVTTFNDTETHPRRSDIEQVLKAHVGSHTLPYPAYSSKTVAGKPLFLYALEGTLHTIEIPTHTETIYRASLEEVRTLSTSELRSYVERALAAAPRSDEPSKALGADFRIKEVQESWDAVFTTDRTYTVLTIRVACASGTYMRTLAARIGESLGTKALALSIARTRIGRYYRVVRLWREIDSARSFTV